jgi:ABC-type transport system substrate-binding protein
MSAGRKLLSVQVALVLMVAFLAWGMIAAGGPPRAERFGIVRQKPKDQGGKKRSEEEEDDKPAKKTDKPKSKKRGEEEDDKAVKPGVGRLADEADKLAPAKATGNLAEALKATTHPQVKWLFNRLLVEADEVTLKRSRGVTSGGTATVGRIRVRPLPQYIPDPSELKGSLSFHILNDSGEGVKEESAAPGRIDSIRYYEQIAVDEVKDFLRQRFTGHAASSPSYLSRYDQLVYAEQALSHVLDFHQSARQTEQRKGEGWDEVEKPLRAQLLEVLLGEMAELRDSKSFDAAFKLVRRVLDTFTRPSDHKLIAGPLAELLRQALKSSDFTQEDFKEARARLKFIEDQFPDSDVIKPIRDSLQSQAKRYFDLARELWGQAQEAKKQGDTGKESKLSAQAKAALQQAEETWPELEGLRNLRFDMARYQVLRVGVRSLPVFLSPGWACTDSELRAVELLFESLVSLTPDERGAMYYRPALAEGRPRVVPLGREFKLPRNAKWTDGRPLGVPDVRFTVQQLEKGKLTGRSPAWAEMLDQVRFGSDPSRVKLPLKQGLLEPLAAMSFKVLPMRAGADDPTGREFAMNPKVTSGPFRYTGRHSEEPTKRLYAGFEANPHYGTRPDKLNLPRIREVRLFPVLDPVKELKEKRLDMALDLTAEQAAQLATDRDFEVPMPSAKTSRRRIYFLAVNNRKLPSAEVRVALARAIAREPLLDEHFRKGLGRQVHKALNGPYPAGSWACNPKLVSRTDKDSLDPFDLDLAKAKLKEGLEKAGLPDKLTLKYPAGDKALEEAMAALCKQVTQELPGVVLAPETRPPHELRVDVEETHNYHLAYYHHDFVDETFWLMPILGATGRGGGQNYLGYTGSLVSKIQAADTRRDFVQVRDHVHIIHRQFLDEMPFIPLWQLDPLFAYRKTLEEVPAVDPQLIFTRVEEWQVKDRSGGG